MPPISIDSSTTSSEPKRSCDSCSRQNIIILGSVPDLYQPSPFIFDFQVASLKTTDVQKNMCFRAISLGSRSLKKALFMTQGFMVLA